MSATLRSLLVIVAALLVPAGSALAAAPTITSPTPSQVVTSSQPTITGTGTVDDSNQVAVNIKGTNGTEGGLGGGGAMVQPDGTWSYDVAQTGNRLDPGTYTVTACQSDECSSPVPFKVGRVSPITSISLAKGTFGDLLHRKLKLTVTCSSECDLQGKLLVSADDARRMASGRAVGSFSKAAAPKGTSTITVTPAGSLGPLSVWPMFAGPVTVTVSVEGDDTTASGSLGWFQVPSDRNGRGKQFIQGVSGPRQVSLSAASATFKVKLEAIPSTRYIVAGIDTPGQYFTSSGKWTKNGRPPTAADFKAGGTFTVTVPIAHPLRGLTKARRLAPAVAELSVGILNKHAQNDSDEARFFVELVK